MKRRDDGPTMSVADAAMALGMSPNYLKDRLREGKLSDIGLAVQGDNGRWRYYIYKTKVSALTGAAV